MTVLGGTKEGPLDANDLPGRRLPAQQLRAHTSSLMTLALESLAFEAPDISFVHAFPGFVLTNLGRDVRSPSAALMRALSRVVGPVVALPPAEVGERMLFIATSARFPARCGIDVELTAGVVAAGKGITVARGSDARERSGVYSVSYDGEPAPPKVEDFVQSLRDQDLVREVWLHTVDEFVRVTGSEFV